MLFMMLLASLTLPFAPAGEVRGGEESMTRRVRPDYLRQTVLVDLQGRLTFNEVFLCIPDQPPVREVYLTINGKAYALNFDLRPNLVEEARKLNGQAALVHATLEEGTLQVNQLKPSATSEAFYKEATHVEALATLHKTWRFMPLPGDKDFPMPIIGVRPEWSVTVDGQSYLLDVGGDAALQKKLEEWTGRRVMVNGTLEYRYQGRTLTGEELRTAPLPLLEGVIRVSSIQTEVMG